MPYDVNVFICPVCIKAPKRNKQRYKRFNSLQALNAHTTLKHPTLKIKYAMKKRNKRFTLTTIVALRTKPMKVKAFNDL